MVILGLAGPSTVAVSLSNAIQKPMKSLWQMSSSLPPTAKRTGTRYHIPSQDYECYYTHILSGSLVVSAVNDRVGHC